MKRVDLGGSYHTCMHWCLYMCVRSNMCSSGFRGDGKGGGGVMAYLTSPCSVKNSHKKKAAEYDCSYLVFLAPPSSKFLDPLLVCALQL